MSPRQTLFAVNAYAGLVTVSVAVALAALTWRLAGDAGVAPAAAPVMARGDGASDIRPLLALAPFGSALAGPAGGDDGALRLKAVFLAVPASASVALIAGSDGKIASYPVGAAVAGGVIDAIEAERIVVRSPTGLRAIGFAAPVVAAAPTPRGGADTTHAVAPPAGLAMARQLGMNPPPPALPPPPPASAGYHVGTNLPPELAATGLRPGDTVLSVNGAPITPGMDEHALMARAMAAGSAQIDVLRDGRRVSLSVAMH